MHSLIMFPNLSLPACETQVAFRRHPLEDGLTFGRLLAVLYIAAFSAFWVVAAVRQPGRGAAVCLAQLAARMSWAVGWEPVAAGRV